MKYSYRISNIAKPPETPVTTPEPEPIEAIAVLLLLQTPPLVSIVNIVVEPIHKLAVPEITNGLLLTINAIAGIIPIWAV